MVQQQTTQNTQMKVVALAMQILGTKNESELKTALSKMSEVGRTKFIQQCSNIIQTGDQSPESLQQAQQLAQMALEEGPEQDYAQMARHGASLRRYYFGGRVKTYDGNYMDLKKPLNKDQVEGRESIGVYKGQWMFLNGDKIAVPRGKAKSKGYDGTAHVNRAYHGMLIPKPQRYDIGGVINKVGDFFSNAWDGVKYGVKKIPQFLETAGKTIGKEINAGVQGAQNFSKDLETKDINLRKFFEDLQPLDNIWGTKSSFGLLSTAANALFTNTPPDAQSTEAQETQEKKATEQGKGAAGADNGTPATPSSTSTSLTKEEMDKIIKGLQQAGIPISDPNTFYTAIQKSLTS